VPTSISAPTRPRTYAMPPVGYVMRVITLSAVVLPAPLAPISATADPSGISNETSSSAAIRFGGGRLAPRTRPANAAMSSRSAPYPSAPR
jgi:hypothetical protein